MKQRNLKLKILIKFQLQRDYDQNFLTVFALSKNSIETAETNS